MAGAASPKRSIRRRVGRGVLVRSHLAAPGSDVPNYPPSGSSPRAFYNSLSWVLAESLCEKGLETALFV